MTSAALTAPTSRLHTAVLGPYVTPVRQPSAAVYRRRRLAVVLVVAGLLAAALLAAGPSVAAFGNDPASVPERRPAAAVHVVQPGDTLWSIARSLQPTGDVRPLVNALERANGGTSLEVGQKVRLP
jgi:Tfp pilus assembly protein FimV